jgi:hypothetical protein
MRRFSDLLAAHEMDLGGSEFLSQGQKGLIRTAAMLELMCEILEQRIAQNDWSASQADLLLYQRTGNSLKRILESLQLNRGRKARDVTPDPLDYARSQHGAAP